MEINPNCSKYEYLLKKNEGHMDVTALSFNNVRISYEELHERIEDYAKVLYKRGIRQGDRIGVCVLNTPESVFLLYALDILGVEVVGLSPFDKPHKLQHDIEITRPKMIISVDTFYGAFKKAEKVLNFSTILYSPIESIDDVKMKLGYKLMQIKNGNFKLSPNANLSSLVKKGGIIYEKAPHIERTCTDILFTGGTTGTHKGVELAGESLNYVVKGMSEVFKAEPGMVHLGNIPIGHMAFGRLVMHLALCNNMEFALTLKAMPEDMYDEAVRTGAHAIVGGPPHWTSLIEKRGEEFVPSSRLKSGSLSNLKYASSGGEALKDATIPAINAALNLCGSDAILGNCLADSEFFAGGIVNNGRVNTPGTLGQPLSTIKIKLINPDTNEIAKDGEPGLLYKSGPCMMLGYFNNPKETGNVITTDENGEKWFNTGDLVRKNEVGEYEYVGRQKRNFVSTVENIYPEQLEEALIELPEIREIVVTPISDPIKQFIPRYHISLYKEIDIKAFEERLRTFVEAQFGENWLPGFIEYYYEPLQRMTNSKVDIGYYRKKDEEDIKNGTLTGEKTLIYK